MGSRRGRTGCLEWARDCQGGRSLCRGGGLGERVAGKKSEEFPSQDSDVKTAQRGSEKEQLGTKRKTVYGRSPKIGLEIV